MKSCNDDTLLAPIQITLIKTIVFPKKASSKLSGFVTLIYLCYPMSFLKFFCFLISFISYLQLLSMHKEIQKQMNVMVSVPVTKEGRRLEGSLGRSMEKVVKANTDALWARLQEENAKQEKLDRDHTQQITNLISNYVNKDMATVLEKIIKKEISSIGSTVARSVSQNIEKTVSSAVMESFQV